MPDPSSQLAAAERPPRDSVREPRRRYLPAALLAAALALCAPAMAPPLGAQTAPAEAAPPLSIEAVVVSPERPAAETLCKLRLRLASRGEKPISGLELAVSVGGHELEVYEHQTFMDLLAPGGETEVELYNFWSSESGRPAPADGKLVVEVRLEKASWLEVTTAEDGTETWTLLDPVPGLPISARVTLAMAGAASATSGR